MPKNKIVAIIFDLDGVLVDTRHLHFLAFQKALEIHGINLTEETHSKVYDGLPTKSKLQMLEKNFSLSSEKIKSIDLAKQQVTLELITNQVKPNPQHISLLKNLKSTGHKLAVCSNSRKETLEIVLNLLGLNQFLEFSMSNEDVKNPKPDPEMYHIAMKKLGETPDSTLIIEDSPHGLKAAYGSGAHVLKVNNSNEVNMKNIEAHLW